MKALMLFLSIIFGVTMTACLNHPENSESESPNSEESHEMPEFSIEFPKTNFGVRKSEFVDEKQNGVKITNWIMQGEEDDNPFMYFIAFNEVPQKAKEVIQKNSKALDDIFKGMLIGSAKKLGGRDFEFQNIQLNAYPGMESVCSVFNGDGLIKSRVYKTGDDFFIVSGGGKEVDINAIDRFLDSFELKN